MNGQFQFVPNYLIQTTINQKESNLRSLYSCFVLSSDIYLFIYLIAEQSKKTKINKFCFYTYKTKILRLYKNKKK